MYFSDAYRIEDPIEEDWFNISLERDSPLFIDPMLVFQNERDDFKNTAIKIKQFPKNGFSITDTISV